MKERLATVAVASMIRNKLERELGCGDGSMGQGRKTRREPQSGQYSEVPHAAHPQDSFSRPREEPVSPERSRREDVREQMLLENQSATGGVQPPASCAASSVQLCTREGHTPPPSQSS